MLACSWLQKNFHPYLRQQTQAHAALSPGRSNGDPSYLGNGTDHPRDYMTNLLTKF